MNEAVEGGSTYFDLKQRVNTIDKEEYENSIKKLKSEVEKNKSFSYKEDLYILLPYKVPIAFQGPITMISGFDASLINNIYDLNPAHKMQELHVLIFPLENSSVILCFTNKNHHRYRSFFKNVKKLSQEDQLAIVQYIVLAYAESPAFSDTLDKKTFNIRSLKTVMGMESTIANSEPSSLSKTIFFAAKEYSCEKAFDLPNLLLPEYSI